MNEDAKKELKSLLDEVKSGVTEEVYKKLLEELPKRKDIFGTVNENHSNSEFSKEDKEKAAEYVRAKFASDGARAKALSAGTATEGAELVPEYFASEIVRVAPTYGVVRRDARIWPMQGKHTVNVPTASAVTAYRVAEKNKITSSMPTSGQVILTLQKLAALIPMSNDLLKDANVDTVDLLARLSAEALSKLEDQWGILGLAAGEGIFQSTTAQTLNLASGQDTYAEVTFDDLLDAMNLLDEGALAGAKWYMSFSVFNALRKIKASTSGEYIMQPPSGGQPATIWNIPVVFSPIMPKTSDASQASKKFIALANFDYMLMGDAKEYELKISQDATVTDTDGSTAINLFEQDMSAVRVIERVDIKLAEADKAFVAVKTAAS